MSTTNPEGDVESLRAEIEELRIRQKHIQNDFLVTRQENEETTIHYMETLSELQQKNRELEALKNNLEKMIEERTRQLRESQQHLMAAQRMEAIGALAGGIAHDFNNILFAIIGYTEMAIEEAGQDSPVAAKLREVLKAGGRARDLVRHILNFSRQEQTEPRPVAALPIFQEVIKLLRASLPSTIDIRTELSRDQLMLMVDPTDIHQILMNLCMNAADAMREKGGILEIASGQATPTKSELAKSSRLLPQSYFMFHVRDTGVGIPPDVMGRIFSPFFTTKPAGRGTGLGLSIVREIVERYCGDIQVESELGKGTLFRIYLPEWTGTAPDSAEAPSPIPRGHGERILFVDDDGTLADMARGMLAGLGYDVKTFTKSMDALSFFQSDPSVVDVVILDQTMPQLTGVELARLMLGERPDLPVILCTGYSESITAEQAAAVGIRAFHYKPLVTRELAESIRLAIDGRPG